MCISLIYTQIYGRIKNMFFSECLFIIFWGACKISKPQLSSFWQKRYGLRKKKEKEKITPTIVVTASPCCRHRLHSAARTKMCASTVHHAIFEMLNVSLIIIYNMINRIQIGGSYELYSTFIYLQTLTMVAETCVLETVCSCQWGPSVSGNL